MTTTHPQPLPPDAVAELRGSVRGRLRYPHDPDYDHLVTGHNRAVTHQPLVVVEPAEPADVAAAVAVATRHGLAVTTQTTGHGTTAPAVGGLLLLTHRLDTIDVDPVAGAVTVGAGTTWGPVLDACDAVGLAPVGATYPTVGVVGFTLGGGIGPLARPRGFAADHVLAMQVVTADGMVRTVDAAQHPDLFWALRGGKTGLGVVTALTLALQPAPRLHAGTAWLPAEQVTAGLAGYLAWTRSAPESVSSSATVLHLPDLPALPPPLRGQHVLQLQLCHEGTPETGARLVEQLLAGHTPVLATFGEHSSATLAAQQAEGAEPMPSWQRGRLLHGVDSATARDTVVQAVTEPMQDPASPLMAVELRHLGGALRHEPAGGNAVGGRQAEYLVSVLGVPVPELFATAVPAAADALLAGLGRYDCGTQLNFHGPVDDAHPLSDAWPPAVHARLTELRHRLDPTGTFA
ncbi:FAD-binding oxidoreductase [Rhodococcus sp. X156]|uniref:FAD-binding oxidoreductase n=1 Tax=Rhodococcus sp. X156 TaxID=2499145 RepID=UPI000FD7FC94|nr:FAD-binding oxidoreductase [Rhodococcus sp. X156]